MRFRHAAVAAVLVVAVLSLSVASLAISRSGPSATTPPPTAALTYVTGHYQYTVWLANASGSGARKLTAGQRPQLSPNGKLVAVVNSADNSVGLYSTTGRLLGTFPRASGYSIYELAWSPDSRFLAVALQTAVRPGDNPYLGLVDTRTLKMRTIVRGWVQGVSFAPATPDRLVYGFSQPTKQGTLGPVNLDSTSATGGRIVQLTHDGLSLYPVWGARGIAFDKETLDRRAGVPGYQIYLLIDGRVTQITHMKVYWLDNGLVPAAVSADGTRLAANYRGESGNAPQAWTVNLTTHALHDLGTWLVVRGISRDDGRVLLDEFSFLRGPRRTGSKRSRSPAGARPCSSPAAGSPAGTNSRARSIELRCYHAG